MTDDKTDRHDDPCHLLDHVRELAQEAGRRIMEIYATDFSVEQKDDNSPLTKADMAAHEAIHAGLKRLTPDTPILSEEQADVPYETRASWRRYWLIDPLDGTREFVKRNGEFTVNIALIEDHQPILGVVHTPVLGVTYYACRGHGAFKHGPETSPEPIHVRSLPDDRIVVAGSRSHRGGSLDQFLESVGEHELVSMGSALKSCLVAEGRADVYPRLGPTSEWDTAAAQAVVEAAGGQVTDTSMQPLRYNTKESLLNPYFLAFGDPRGRWAEHLPPEAKNDQSE